MASGGDESVDTVDDATTVSEYSLEEVVSTLKDLKVDHKSLYGNVEVTRKAVMKIEHNLAVVHESYKDHLGPTCCNAVKRLNTTPVIVSTTGPVKLTPQDRRRLQLKNERESAKVQKAAPSTAAADDDGDGAKTKARKGKASAATGADSDGGAGRASGSGTKGAKAAPKKKKRTFVDDSDSDNELLVKKDRKKGPAPEDREILKPQKKCEKRTDGRNEGCVGKGTTASLARKQKKQDEDDAAKEANPKLLRIPKVDYNVMIHPLDDVGRKTHKMANVKGLCLMYECDMFVPFPEDVVNDKMLAILQPFEVTKASELSHKNLASAVVSFTTEMMNYEVGQFPQTARPMFFEGELNFSTEDELRDPEAFATSQPEPFRSIFSIMLVKWKLLDSGTVEKEEVTAMLANAARQIQPYIVVLRHSMPAVEQLKSQSNTSGDGLQIADAEDEEDNEGDNEDDEENADNSDDTEEENEDD